MEKDDRGHIFVKTDGEGREWKQYLLMFHTDIQIYYTMILV